MTSENHVKIHVTFPLENGGPGGESMWAERTDKPNHFRVDNLPFYAMGICHNDVVRCEERDGYLHEVVEVVERAPLKLMRVIFLDEDEEVYLGMTKGMDDKFMTNWERAHGNFFAVTVPDENFEAFFGELERLCGLELLHFETCEQYEEGHFGPGPDEEDEEEDEEEGN